MPYTEATAPPEEAPAAPEDTTASSEETPTPLSLSDAFSRIEAYLGGDCVDPVEFHEMLGEYQKKLSKEDFAGLVGLLEGMFEME